MIIAIIRKVVSARHMGCVGRVCSVQGVCILRVSDCFNTDNDIMVCICFIFDNEPITQCIPSNVWREYYGNV